MDEVSLEIDNENIHGSGTEKENLTPLSVKGNSNHKIKIEETLKRITRLGGVVSYTVDPIYGRDLETEDSARPEKFSDDKEWEDIKEIRKAESKAVPTHLSVTAYLMEKNTKEKFGFKSKQTIMKSETIRNKIDEKLENYNLGGEKIEKIKFLLRDQKIEELESLKGIDSIKANKIYDRLHKENNTKGKSITNYKEQIGISKEDLDKDNSQYNIIGSL